MVFGLSCFNSFIGFWDFLVLRWQHVPNKDWLLSLAASLLLQIWKGRNSACFEQKVCLPRVLLIKSAVDGLQEFLTANQPVVTPLATAGIGTGNLMATAAS